MEKSLKEYILSRTILEFKAKRSSVDFSDLDESRMTFDKFTSFVESVGGLEGSHHDFRKGEKLSDEYDYFVTKYHDDLERKFLYGDDNGLSYYAILSGSFSKGVVPIVYIMFTHFNKTNQFSMYFLWNYRKNGTISHIPSDSEIDKNSCEELVSLLKTVF